VSDKFEPERQLLAAIKSNRDQIKVLFDEASSHWGYEDQVYRCGGLIERQTSMVHILFIWED
jgi:hypothetical protein